MRTSLSLLALASAIAAPIPVSAAKAPVEAVANQAAAYRQLDPVALREPVKDAEPEQWEDRPGEGLGVRNVVNPTLTPVLPAEDKSNGLAVIVAPGGGFVNLAFDNEGMRVARYLAGQGIAAFVLKYRLRPTPRDEREYRESLTKLISGGKEGDDLAKPSPIVTPAEPVQDGQAALRTVRARAREWGVDPAKVGMIGFSAGAMTTLAVGLAEDRAARPDFIAPIYGPRDPGPIPADAPPMFLAIALDDPLFKAESTIALIEGWSKVERPMEVHLYEKGGHGFGMTPRTQATGLWTGQFIAWLKDRGLFLGAAERREFEFQALKIGAILNDPAMREVLERHLPGFSSRPEAGLTRNLTLKELSTFAPQVLPAEKYKAIVAELAALP